MKKKFRLIVAALAATLCLCFGIVACGPSDGPADDPQTEQGGNTKPDDGNDNGGTTTPDDENGGTTTPDDENGGNGEQKPDDEVTAEEWERAFDAVSAAPNFTITFSEAWKEKYFEEYFGEYSNGFDFFIKVDGNKTEGVEGYSPRHYLEENGMLYMYKDYPNPDRYVKDCVFEDEFDLGGEYEYNYKAVRQTPSVFRDDYSIFDYADGVYTCSSLDMTEYWEELSGRSFGDVKVVFEDIAVTFDKGMLVDITFGIKLGTDDINILMEFKDFGTTTVELPTEYDIGSEGLSVGGGIFIFRLRDNSYELTGWRGSATTVEIPAAFHGKPVTSIGDDAFRGCSGLTSIVIPDSVTSIGSYAFRGCSGLTSIVIPDSVTSIGDTAFEGTAYYNDESNWEGDVLYIGNHLIEAKQTISGAYTIKEGTKTIAVGAFYQCGLTSVTIPDSVTEIGGFAFQGCGRLTGELIIPDNVTEIGGSAFSGCSGLTGELIIPDGVTEIGGSAFSGCSGLKIVTIGNSVTSIGWYAFAGCSGLKSVTIGNSVTSIGWYAFWGCSGLTSVTIGSSVTSIGDSAFWGCSGLTSITIPDSVTSIGSVAFEGTAYYNDESKWEDDVLYIGNHLIKAKETISGAYTIREGTKTIADRAFYNCSGLTGELIIPDGVTLIGWYAFSGCSGLTSVTWNAENCTTAYRPFEDCTQLSTVTIGENVKTIPAYAFCGCSGLASITIPDSVESIGAYAFCGCSGLASITIPDSVESIGGFAFAYCSGLTSITIPDSVESIEYAAFSFCDGLTSVTFKDPDGWKVSGNSDMSDAQAVDVTDPAQNAEYLTDTYCYYYWKRS